jgi:hypothetical protein
MIDTLNVHRYLIVPASALAQLGAVVALLRGGLRPAVARVLAVVAIALALVEAYIESDGSDFRIFWRAGRDVLAGLDPYAPDRIESHLFLHPPSALPLFASFAALPEEWALRIWLGLSAVAGAGLVALAVRVLRAQEGPSWSLPPGQFAVLTAAVALCGATTKGIDVGQLHIYTTAVIYLALWAQGRGRPGLAGSLLGAATPKVVTAIPFFLLFLRGRDRRAWPAAAVVVVGLSFMASAPADLPGRVAAELRYINHYGAEGRVNDYSYKSRHSVGIVGFDHALYRLGMRDRGAIRAAQAAVLAGLGLVVLVAATRRDVPRGAACALTCIYSTLFLYHRLYDLTMLVLPLTYAAGRAGTESRAPRRRLFVAAAILLLVAMNMQQELLRRLTLAAPGWGGAGRIVQAVVLPYPTWTILAAMACLVAAEWPHPIGSIPPEGVPEGRVATV